MCCGFAILALLGPRFLAVVWWLFRPGYFAATFNTIIWPVLGIIFVPWTTIMYLLVAPGGVHGFDWVWLGLALLVDIATYTGSAYGNKDKLVGASA